MEKEIGKKFNNNGMWVIPSLVFIAVLNSCSEMNQIREYDENPLCREMRRTCKEYDEYKELAGQKKSQKLNELQEECHEYSKSCGHALGQAGK